MMDERLLRAGTIVFDVGKVLLSFEPERVASLLPAEHRAALKEAMFGEIHRWSEFDLGRSIAELKRLGKRLYALTNYAEPSFTLTRERFPALKELDGEAVSSREKLCKPDRELYRRLIERYGIDPAESLFIDDREENVRAGAEVGFRVWHYTDGDLSVDSALQSV